MQAVGLKRRLPSLTLALLVWLGFGLTAPVLVTIYSSDFALHDAVVAAPRDVYAISRPIELSALPRITVERGTIIALNAAGKPTSGAETDAMLSAGSANLVLDGATLSIAGRTPSEVDDIRPPAPLATALTDTRYELIAIRRGAIVFGLGGSDTETMTDVHANISLKRKGAITAKGNGLVRGQRVTFDLMVAVPAERKQPQSQSERLPIKLTLKNDLIETHIDGRVGQQDGIEIFGQGEVSMPRVRRVARWFGLMWPTGSGFLDFAIKGQIELSKQTIAFERANVRMDGNEAGGTLALAFGGARPLVLGTLAFKSFNAQPYLTIGNVADPQSNPPEPFSWTGLASDTLSMWFGSAIDADLRVSTDRVITGIDDLGRSAATVVLKDGRLLADIAELAVLGGDAVGQIAADFNAAQPRLTFKGKLGNVELGRLSKVLIGQSIVQGPGAVVADLVANGSTGHDILQSLSGKLMIKAQSAGRLGLDLKALSTAVDDKPQEGWGTSNRTATGFDHLDLKFVLRDGVLLTESADVLTTDAAWTATGVVNLALGQIDARLTQQPTAPAAQRAGQTLPRQSTIELRGPWQHPLIRTIGSASIGEPVATTSPPPNRR